MKKCGMLASALLLSGCASVHTATLGASLVLKPQIQEGAYATNTTVSPYTLASINHLILKLFTYNGAEHDQNIQKSIPNANLGNAITFSNLKANTTYRIKAFAYASSDESLLISTIASDSYTDVTLTDDDHPTFANLKVKLVDIPFNGQGTGRLQVTNGGYLPADPEAMQFIIQGVVSTFAGGAGGTSVGYLDGMGTAAKFNTPCNLAVDGAGNVYVTDSNMLRKITSGTVVSTLAGSSAGYLDGTGTAAKFAAPYGVVSDASGNLYVMDASSLIRKVTNSGVVSTFAGQQSVGYANGAGTAAKFNNPYGSLAIDGAGNVYVADLSNNLVRKITSSGVVSTLAGGAGGTIAGYLDGLGTSSKFNWPSGIAVDGAGNIYVSDYYNNLVRKITSGGVVSTLAGGAGGTAAGYLNGLGTAALFNGPSSMAVDVFGNVYVADFLNHCIRKITSDGVVSTLAGQGATSGYLDGTGTAAKFKGPSGLAIDGNGNMYIADQYNHLIRVVK